MTQASSRWTEAAQVAALFVLLAATQAGAGAGDIVQCDSQRESSHSFSGDAFDLGGGVVSYFTVSVYSAPEIVGYPKPPNPISRNYKVEDCASGRYIAVQGYNCEDFSMEADKCVDRRGFVDVEDKLDRILRKAAATDSRVAFSDLFAQLKALPGEATMNKPGKYDGESCACAAAYPELRGNKDPWSKY